MKIIQIINQGNSIVGLCENGKIYRFETNSGTWVPMESVDEETV